MAAAPRLTAIESTMSDDPNTRYRMDLAYLGTGLYGWQAQLSKNTVQDLLEEALGVFLRHTTRVAGASRTDTGVHAMHQVASFETNVAFDEMRWLKALRHLLPPGIGVQAIRPVPREFHPILAAKGKIYLYRIWQGPTANPFVRPFAWKTLHPSDLSSLQENSRDFLGSHDFSAFCAADSSAKTKVRQIHAIECQEIGPELRLWIAGRGFLKQQIRIMVGTLVEIAIGKRPSGQIPEILATKDRKLAGRTAPAEGLTLMRVLYDDSIATTLRALVDHPPL